MPPWPAVIMAPRLLSSDPGVPLRVDGLSVRYGERWAVHHLTFAIRPGEVYGLLGSNGAGKSSTIKSVVGLVRPAEGSLSVFGHDPIIEGVLTKRQIGYVPESPLLFDALSPREFLEFIAGVRGLAPEDVNPRVANYARAFQIEAEFERPISTLSNGVRQKVLLMAALLHQPPLLVMDEPFNNLDPRAVRIMKDLLLRYAHEGQRGILFSTHTMEVAERLCDRIGILDHGVLRGEGTLQHLREEMTDGNATLEEIFLRLTEEEEGVRDAVQALGGT
ncbi:MAG: ABC transporter ATP-binding protein [Thermoplasmata archaeon]